MNQARLILFGTPEFAAESFRALIESEQYEILAIVSQPDREAGRGMSVKFSPVKELANEKNITLLQPISLKGISLDDKKLTTTNKRNADFIDVLNSLAPVDALIVIAYGKIIPSALLSFPRSCAVNIHGSLLPRWRGAAPIHRALAAGDLETGVGIMKLEEGLDVGAVYAETRTSILPSDNFGTLHDGLAKLGKELLLETLPQIISGSLSPKEQSTEGITYAEKWDKTDLEINWNEPALVTINRIRASSPFPGARTFLQGELVKIFQVDNYASGDSGKAAGVIVEVVAAGVVVQLLSNERLLITELQLSGKKRLPAAEVVRGRGLKIGDQFSVNKQL